MDFGFLPQMGGLLGTIAAFLAALSVIVAIHEYGHYIVGRWSGIHADVFSLGFGPRLASFTDRRGTRWQFALFPLGGYVKFRGDGDAASASQSITDADPRTTMHGAPLWARSLTVAAGPVFNFVLSILIFGAVIFAGGTTRDQLSVGEILPLPYETGLQPGDVLRDIAGQPVPRLSSGEFNAFLADLPRETTLPYTVERAEGTREITGPYPMLPIVDRVMPQSAALAAGLQGGDVITRADGAPLVTFDDLKQRVEASRGAPIDLTIWRTGEVLDITLAPKEVDEPTAEGGFATQWRIGISGTMAFTPATDPIGPVAALTAGAQQTWAVISGSISGIGHMITGAISTCNLSGPIGIAETSGAMAAQGFEQFIWFIAVLSTAVGLMNLFPIPVLDGGHLVFFAYEAVAGRPPSDAALRILMGTGFALLIGLMLFAVMNDIFC